MRARAVCGLLALAASLLAAAPVSASIYIHQESEAAVNVDPTPSSDTEGVDIRDPDFTADASTATVPEPMTWAMMLLGFAAVSVALRGKKQTEVRYRIL